MSKTNVRSHYKSVFNLTAHVVFITKYCRRVIDAAMLEELEEVFSSVSKTMWNRHENRLKRFYWKEGKRVFWTGAYFIASCGGVTIEQLKEYVRNQDYPKV
jgi:putative transposase